MKTIRCDFGNSALKYSIEEDAPRSLPSICATLTADQAADFEAYDEFNKLIIRGDKRVLWGQHALSFKGVLNASTDKLEVLTDPELPGFLATLTPDLFGVPLKLVLTVPRVREFERSHPTWAKDAARNYTVTINGKLGSFNIHSIQLEDETTPAFKIARAEKKAATTGNTQAIDIGAGTVILAVFDPEGRQIDRQVLNGHGTIQLTEAIANDPQLVKRLTDHWNDSKDKKVQVTPSVSQVDRGLRGQFLYGATGVSFQDIAEKHIKQWLGDILREAKLQEVQHDGGIERRFYAGGGAELVRKVSEKQKPFVLKDPLYASVRGLAA
jgi:hypothetical protein